MYAPRASINEKTLLNQEVNRMRTLRKLWKDENSGKSGCPALYEVEDGYVVQGIRLSAAEHAQLDQLAANEDAVLVPRNVLDRLKDL